ncbi:MAG: hypothetical protein H6742_08455 [Alphaproteobacteria bacterium]|nr:hypothetical protein [Alphaproteobacteria bacterium]
MRASVPGSLPALLLALLLGPTSSHAAPRVVEAWVAWGSASGLSLSPGGPDQLAQGPEQLAVGPDGVPWLFDPVQGEVVPLAADGGAHRSFPVRHCSDLLVVDDGLLVLDHSARTLTLWSPQGVALDSIELPALVPTHVGLAVDGDRVLARDPFGNLHPVGVLDGGLRKEDGPLEEVGTGVRWREGMLSTEGLQLSLPDALRASGQRFGDWLIVDEVRSDEGPLVVERTAWHVPTGQSVALPVRDRAYAPRGDAAALPDGGLLVLVPWDDGLSLIEVQP